LPWPKGYDPQLKTLEAENGSVKVVDYIYSPELHRMFIALHYNLPHKSMVEFALYTEPDHSPPVIKLKRTLPRKPAINKDVKAYITVQDDGWGIKNVQINATADRGSLESFEVTKLSETTYIAHFKVKSNFTSNVTIFVTATDFAGNTNTSTFTIKLAGPSPPSGGSTATTTQPPGTTSPATTATPPAGGGGQTTSGGSATTSEHSPASPTSTGIGATGGGQQGGATAQPSHGGRGMIIALIIIVILIIAGIYVLKK